MSSKRSPHADTGANEGSHPLESLQLSARAYNALRRRQITTVEQVAGMSEREIGAVSGVGKKTLREILAALERYRAQGALGPPGSNPGEATDEERPLLAAWRLPSRLASDEGGVARLQLDTASHDALRRHRILHIRDLCALTTGRLAAILPDASLQERMRLALIDRALLTGHGRTRPAEASPSPLPQAAPQPRPEGDRETPAAKGPAVRPRQPEAQAWSPGAPAQVAPAAGAQSDGPIGYAPAAGRPERAPTDAWRLVEGSLEDLVALWLRGLGVAARLAVAQYYGLGRARPTGDPGSPGRIGQVRSKRVLQRALDELRGLAGGLPLQVHLQGMARFLADTGGLASAGEVRAGLPRYVKTGDLDPVAACRLLGACDRNTEWLPGQQLLGDARKPLARVSAIRAGVRRGVPDSSEPVPLSRALFTFAASRGYRLCDRPDYAFVMACLRTDPGVQLDGQTICWLRQEQTSGA